MLLGATRMSAQLSGSGFYRVQNYATERYVTLIDNYGRIDINSTTADMGAIETKKPFDRIAADPASIIYFESAGGGFYDMRSQGTGLVEILHFHINLADPVSQTPPWNSIYLPSVTAYGTTAYLFDQKNTNDVGKVLSSGSDKKYSYWYIHPVTNEDNYYLGIAPSLKVGNAYYQTYFAEYGFSANDSRTQFFIVEKVENGVAVWKEVTGEVPTTTPVIVRSTSSSADDNKITPKATSSASVGTNLLHGVYFCNNVNQTSPHYNVTKFNASTMRVLGTMSDGSLGFVKPTEELVPANTAYLAVPAGTPDELKLMTQAEYDAYLAELAHKNTPVTLTANSYTVEYGEAMPHLTYNVEGTLLSGEPVLTCTATATSPVGTYPITIARGTVENSAPVLVNGTLTITPAALTIKADAKTKKHGEAMPKLTATFSGFKNNETSAVLTKQPTLTCEATASSAPGTYPITVGGAEAANYTIAYTAGVLTVTEADPITLTANSFTIEYGEAVPHLTYSSEGAALTGEPVLTCEAKVGSPVGTYPIVIAKGTVGNYNDHYVNGTLTITPAALTIKADAKTKKQGEAMPKLTATFSGFKNNETSAVLTKQPTLTCEATAESAPGTYPITVGGAEAANYTIAYTAGVLTVTEADPITLTANSFTIEYGEAVPHLTYSSEGAALTGEPVLTCEAKVGSPVGTYPIVIAKGTVGNYNDHYVNGTLTITKAPLTVSVGNYEREEREENPVFELTYSGFKLNDDATSLTTQPVATCEATADSPAGEYAITVSGGESPNYDFTYVTGTLTVKVSSGIEDASIRKPLRVYTCDGRRIVEQIYTTSQLPRGLYIVNGRKIAVK